MGWQGIENVRRLFPLAKFIFHWRNNLTRIVDSDFWRKDSFNGTTNFAQVVARYREYAHAHRDHTFITTIEGIASKKRTAQLSGLFQFLGEELTPELRRVAKARLVLQDWSEQTHTRRFKNGVTQRFAFTEAAEALVRNGGGGRRKARAASAEVG